MEHPRLSLNVKRREERPIFYDDFTSFVRNNGNGAKFLDWSGEMEKFEREGKGGRWAGIEVVTRIISLCVKLGNE